MSDWASPDTLAIWAAAAAVAFSAAVTGVSPETVAVTLCAPAVLPRVTVVWALPPASVTAVSGLGVAPPVPDANATTMPGTPAPPADRTCTTTGWGSAAPAAPVCPPPLTSATLEGGAEIVIVAVSLSPASVAPMTRVVPAVPLGVNVEEAESTVPRVGSATVQWTPRPMTAAPVLSVAVMRKGTAPLTRMAVSRGAMAKCTSVAPGPTYLIGTSDGVDVAVAPTVAVTVWVPL